MTDFDAEGKDDPLQVSEYAFDIFEYYKNREVRNGKAGWKQGLTFPLSSLVEIFLS